MTKENGMSLRNETLEHKERLNAFDDLATNQRFRLFLKAEEKAGIWTPERNTVK